jgi:hypothetical protein
MDRSAAPPLQEAALRALVSLSYTDRMALRLGVDLDVLPLLLANCHSDRRAAQRFSLMVILNLSAHDENKRRVLASGGVEAMVGCAGSDDAELRALAASVLRQLADLKAVDALWRAKAAFGVGDMLQLVSRSTTDPSTLRLAVESLAEQVWLEPQKQDELAASGGVQVLLGLVAACQDERVLLPALWGLRNATHDHPSNQSLVGEKSGVALLLEVCRHHVAPGQGDVLESALSALVNVCVGHERNCRRLLGEGLDALLDVAEGSQPGEVPLALTAGFAWDEAMGDAEVARAKARRAGAVNDATATNQALATSLLQIVGPYNWVICANCSQKSFGGSTCKTCGRAISFSF